MDKQEVVLSLRKATHSVSVQGVNNSLCHITSIG